MGRLVQKFGSHVLPDVESIRKAAEIAIRAAEEGNEVAAVISSMGKTSAQLRAVAEMVAPNPNPRDMDMLLTTAEQASVALMSMAIQALGWPARSFTAAQAGIVTENRHGDAPIKEIDCEEIENSLARGEIAVIGGFQGVTDSKELTTVGDGGVDASAIALACSLEAERCDIFCDTSGVCTADPRVVPKAKVLASISYEEMLELSFSGLHHLHPEAVELAMDNLVPIRIRPINNYEHLGTIITQKQSSSESSPCSVALDEEHAAMTIKIYNTGPEERPLEGFTSLFARMDELAINTGMVMLLTHEDEPAQELSFTVDKRHVPRVRSIIDSLAAVIDHPIVRVDPQIATISIIGRGLGARPEVVSNVFEVLERSSIPVTMVSTSDLRVSVVLPALHARNAVRLVHARFQLPFEALD
jgi:aspartate kinase